MEIKQLNQKTVVKDSEVKAKAKGRKPVPENETALDRFKRLANMRVPKAVKSLRLIENLFTGAQYNWQPEDSQAVIAALSEVILRIQDRAENAGKSTEETKFHI